MVKNKQTLYNVIIEALQQPKCLSLKINRIVFGILFMNQFKLEKLFLLYTLS